MDDSEEEEDEARRDTSPGFDFLRLLIYNFRRVTQLRLTIQKAEAKVQERFHKVEAKFQEGLHKAEKIFDKKHKLPKARLETMSLEDAASNEVVCSTTYLT